MRVFIADIGRHKPNDTLFGNSFEFSAHTPMDAYLTALEIAGDGLQLIQLYERIGDNVQPRGAFDD